MFGFKLIREDELFSLRKRLENAETFLQEESSKIEKLKSDCQSLRSQNGKLRIKVNQLETENAGLSQFKTDAIDALGSIDLGGFHIGVHNSACNTCNTCKEEHKDCRKYTFGKHDFCVIPNN